MEGKNVFVSDGIEERVSLIYYRRFPGESFGEKNVTFRKAEKIEINKKN